MLPGLNRKLLVYWASEDGKSGVVDTEKLFEEGESEPDAEESSEDNGENNPDTSTTRPSAHNLPVQDE